MKRNSYLYMFITVLFFSVMILFLQQEIPVGAVPELKKILIDPGQAGKHQRK